MPNPYLLAFGVFLGTGVGVICYRISELISALLARRRRIAAARASTPTPDPVPPPSSYDWPPEDTP